MDRRIGVYICHCGTNIAATVNVEEVAEFAGGLDSVAVARHYPYMCSDPGQNLIKEDIKNLGLNRVVVASCSPRMHERTFRRACAEAGLNPYLFEMANIREHCSWVHEDGATEKAKALVKAAVQRVFYHEPLEIREVPMNPNVLVIGGGIAGIQAALKIADAGHKVYLVEREPSIGGHMAQLDKTFPTLDCSACILTPKMVDVGQHPNITLLTYAEVKSVQGYIGNFEVEILQKARKVNHATCTGCGTCWQKCPEKVPSEFNLGRGERKAIYIPFAQAVPNKPVVDTAQCRYIKWLEWSKTKEGKKPPECRICEKLCLTGSINWEQQDQIIRERFGAIIVATGYDAFDPSVMVQYGYGRFDNVVTGLEFERLSNADGPTRGRILLKDGREPKSVAIIHCVGSRNKNYHDYCSRICCMYSIKFAHLVREKTGAKVYQLYNELKSSGKGYEEFYNRVMDEGVIFIRSRPAEIIRDDGRLVVLCEDTLADCLRRIPVDMVILSTALQPRADANEVAKLLTINQSADGFFMERHPKLDPIATATDGIFVVGCCQGPKDIPDTVAQASAGAAEALVLIDRGHITLEAVTATVEEALCQGCGRCEDICEFHAPKVIKNERWMPVSKINEALCKGCGACAVVCPTGAISIKHFTRDQVLAMVDALAVG